MLIQFTQPLAAIRGLNKSILTRLEKLGIKTISDLLFHFPFRYDDFSNKKEIKDLREGEMATIVATVKEIKSRRSFRRRMSIIEALLEDQSGTIRAVWFNQYHVTRVLKPGMLAALAGKPHRDNYGFYLASPNFEAISASQVNATSRHTGRLIPIYPETKGASSKMIRLILSKVSPLLAFPQDYFPNDFLKEYKLPSIKSALRSIHFPQTLEEAATGKRRFLFETLFFWQISLLQQKNNIQSRKAIALTINLEQIKQFLAKLPFELTADQKKSLWEILKDMEHSYPMNRLLEGEVGSGKTIVAATAALNAAMQNKSSAFLAPTEVLAYQHFHKLKEILREYDFSLGLFTGGGAYFANQGLETKTKKESLAKSIANGEIKILIGTHALLSEKLSIPDLAFLVVDEQHRFGIEQRAMLAKKYEPHFLSMTATPIPRTLALGIYGDLDISVIKTLPKNRIPIKSEVIPPARRKEIYEFIRSEVKQHHQVFIICPRVEPPEPSAEDEKPLLNYKTLLMKDAKAVKVEFERLKKEVFTDLRLEMLHGKMRSVEKEDVMRRFANKEFDVLVATSVIEVGVDIPHATVIVIEGAEHFGLAQLHQFRGRVGRSNLPSYCFLLSESPAASANKRLTFFANNFDGFALAEYDLKLRGPGEILGEHQSGFPDELMKALKDPMLIRETRDAAKNIIQQDPTLNKFFPLKARFAEFQKKIKTS